MEVHVHASNVSLAADSGDKQMTTNSSPQLHYIVHIHVKNSHVEGSTVMSKMHKQTQNGVEVIQESFQGPFRLSKNDLIYVTKIPK